MTRHREAKAARQLQRVWRRRAARDAAWTKRVDRDYSLLRVQSVERRWLARRRVDRMRRKAARMEGLRAELSREWMEDEEARATAAAAPSLSGLPCVVRTSLVASVASPSRGVSRGMSHASSLWSRACVCHTELSRRFAAN